MAQRQLILDALKQNYERRENFLEECGMVIQECGTAISLVHRGENEDAKKLLESARNRLNALSARSTETLLFPTDVLKDSRVEFVEAACLLSVATTNSLPTYPSLKVRPDEYLLGLADFIGELRRRCLEQIRMGDYERASSTFELMETVYEFLWSFEYPKKFVKDLRRKLDVNRKLVDETRFILAQARIVMRSDG